MEQKPNLWLRYWYATILPGGIGLMAIFIGLTILKQFVLVASIVSLTGVCLTLIQAICLMSWTFSKKGDSDHWLVVKDGRTGEILYITKPRKNFMVPTIKDYLALIRVDIPLVQQFAFGDGPYEEEEEGASLREVDYTRMEINKDEYENINLDDPLNIDAPGSNPSVRLNATVTNPLKVIQMGGMEFIAGQLAEVVSVVLQALLAGTSPAWLNKNARLVAEKLNQLLAAEMEHRGITIEEGNGFNVVSHGTPKAITDAILNRTVAAKEGDAKITVEAKAAEAADHEARRIITLAQAEADANRKILEAAAYGAKAELDVLRGADIEGPDISRILRQRAIKGGLPIIPEGVQEVIIGGGLPELWQETGRGGAKKPGEGEGGKK